MGVLALLLLITLVDNSFLNVFQRVSMLVLLKNYLQVGRLFTGNFTFSLSSILSILFN